VLFPDTQYYNGQNSYVFSDQANWVVANQSALNIKMVLGIPPYKTDKYNQFTVNFPNTSGGPDTEIVHIVAPLDVQDFSKGAPAPFAGLLYACVHRREDPSINHAEKTRPSASG
jgi:hypothetical protein